MSTTNISAFLAKAQTDSALAEKIHLATAAALVRVAYEEGLPFTLEDYVAATAADLSDEALSDVAGGFKLAHIRTLGDIYRSGSESRQDA